MNYNFPIGDLNTHVLMGQLQKLILDLKISDLFRFMIMFYDHEIWHMIYGIMELYDELILKDFTHF